MMKLLEHEHLLKLVDLRVKDEDAEEFDDDEADEELEKKKDLVTQDAFVCHCKRCHQPINEYYRYYYKCSADSCDYSVHTFCAELPTKINHLAHSHPLILAKSYRSRLSCCSCGNEDTYEVCYRCVEGPCYFTIDISCGVEVDKKRIHHPSHPHSLVPLISKPILCYCNACGKEHKGIFFLCITCPNFALHIDCAFLPKSLLIQHTTDGIFHHTHPLTLSYSFPEEKQSAKYHPPCRVCDGSFLSKGGNLWLYKCEKCIYYAHLDCATSRKEPFMSILSIKGGRMIKNFQDGDYPDIFHLPFPNQTYTILGKLLFKEVGTTTYGIDKVSLQHMGHHHELILVNEKCTYGASSSKYTSSLMLCHNPMKKIELLCNACVRPIMEIPFYNCGASGHESCNFARHEWCTRLPSKVDSHPDHAQHTLFLMSHAPVLDELFNIFYCSFCLLPCNGYAYACVECHYCVDVTCAFIPQNITHKSHSNHLLSIYKGPLNFNNMPWCIMCRGDGSLRVNYSCRMCDVYIHPECALLPETIRHSYDKHPMKLSYHPIENHKSEYFCEICENKLNPHSCFYHCDVCVQSVHSVCAPLILCCETETFSWYGNNIYLYSNVKFGSIHKFHDHPHPLSFVQGIESDGQCNMCSMKLVYWMIFKCFECKFAIDYKCCRSMKKYNNSLSL